MAGTTPSQRITIPGRDDLRDISATPGGTIWATTPGGTRIAYDRSALLFMRNSPHARTPPVGMSSVPGITSSHVTGKPAEPHPISNGPRTSKQHATHGKEEKDDLFEMEN